MNIMKKMYSGETVINQDLGDNDIYKTIMFFNNDGTETTFEGNFIFRIIFDKYNNSNIAEFEDREKGITIRIDERCIKSHKGVIVATDKENYHLYTEIKHIDPELQNWVKEHEPRSYIWLCGDGDGSKPKIVRVDRCFNCHMIVDRYYDHPAEEGSRYHVYPDKQYLYATVDIPEINISEDK